MSDTIFSVRIDEEMKIKFADTAKIMGINNKDFMELLISNYELNKLTEKSTLNIQSDVSELQHITKRMLDIYLNLIDKINLSEKEKEDITVKALEEKMCKIIELEEYLLNEESINKELSNSIIDLQKEIATLKKKNQSTEEIHSNFNSLKSMLEEKVFLLNNELGAEHEKFSTLEDENKGLHSKLKNKEELEIIVNNYKEENLVLKSTIERIKKDNDIFNENLKLKYEKDLSFIEEKFELEKSKAVFSIREENYNKLRSQQELFENKSIEFLKHINHLNTIIENEKKN
ncbi:MAG: hypothetical protein RSB70_00550 [Clostridium sp.]